MTVTDTRTPLWQMTDEQLLFIANDDLAEWDRRKTAVAILRDRDTTSEEDGA